MVSSGSKNEQMYFPQQGDILFQSISGSKLTNAIIGITKSDFSHCGIIDNQNGKWVVVEALGKVHITGIDDWIKQGNLNKYAVYRLNQTGKSNISEIMTEVRKMIGRPYDYSFEITDSSIYCSELIYHAYKKVTGNCLGKTDKLGSLNWKPYEKYIRSICAGKLPLERELITPKALSEAPQLELVYSDFNKQNEKVH